MSDSYSKKPIRTEHVEHFLRPPTPSQIDKLRQEMWGPAPEERIAGAMWEAEQRISPQYGIPPHYSSQPPMTWNQLHEREKALRIAIVRNLIDRGIIQVGEALRG
jgi:hypothetical protein